MHYMKRPRIPDEPRLLPLDWKEGEYTVMIGRGRRCIHNEGNKRFRAMVKAELQAYSVGRKAKKSSIIKRILREINNNCLDGVGFVKQDAMTGRYYTATVTAAKVTIAQAFRDALHDIGYKSSKQHKQFKRDIARGKIDPTGAAETSIARVCSTCCEEVNLQLTAAAAESGVAQVASASDDIIIADNEPTNNNTTTVQAPPAKVPSRSAEASLQFWGDCIDPLVEFEHSYPPPPAYTEQPVEEEDNTKQENVMICGKVAHICGCESHHHHQFRHYNNVRTAQAPTKVMDPFEPIPLEPIPLDHIMDTSATSTTSTTAAEGGEAAVWGTAATTPHEKVGESSEFSGESGAHFHLESDDDDDDHAMVVWATEFVHCPLCSLVQGRGDFDDLPIHDIRKSLIG